MQSVAQRARLALHAVLRGGDSARPMAEAFLGGATFLAGQTGNLSPVLFLAGGAAVERAPYPALGLSFDLEPGASRTLVWAQAALHDPATSFEAARQAAGRSWDAEIARVELVNASLVDIETGEEDWDAALAMAQKVALGAYVGPTRSLPCASFVLTRLPDRGYSEGGDGRDYDLQWDGQPPLVAYLNLSNILPVAPDLAKGVIRNYLAARTADGGLDGKPGLGGQRSRSLCIPILATLAWRIYEHTQDEAFLRECFPLLVENLETWFSPAHDRDQDGFPEWDHTLHAGFDDWPSFVRWREWGQGLDLTLAETPDLASYLYRECLSLCAAGTLLGRTEVLASLQERAARLRQAVEATWSESTFSYQHRDRDLHVTPSGEVLGKGTGSFRLRLGRSFDPPVRVIARCTGPETQTGPIRVLIDGRGRRSRGRIERLTAREFQWFWDRGTATSAKVYQQIEAVEVRGLTEDYGVEFLAADFSREDISLLLPVWAGIPEGRRAERIILRSLFDPERFWRAYGIPVCSARDPAFDPTGRQGSGGVSMIWNQMLGEALVQYDFRERAAELMRRLMQAVIHSLRNDGGFSEIYGADRPGGFGLRDHQAGVAPVGLFLQIVGVRLLTPHRVALVGTNPFSWPVTVRWRGLEVRREPKGATQVTFPNGQRVEVTGEEPRLVEQLDQEAEDRML
jgi:hypothetical protein